MNLVTAVEGFLLYSTANGLSPNTLAIYKLHLNKLITYLHNPEMGDIKPDDILHYYAWYQSDYTPVRIGGDTSPLHPSTIYNCWCAIRSFFNWSEKELGIKRVDGKILAPRWTPPDISPYSQDEIKKLIHSCEATSPASTHGRKAFVMRRPTAQRDLAILLTMLDTGIRVSECSRLRVRDLNMETGELYICPYGSGVKTKSRHVWLGSAALKNVWKYVASRNARPDDYMFVTEAGDQMNRGSIKLIFDRLGQRAGVQRANCHRFRHTFAIQYLRNGGDVFTLQRLLGHSTLDMVKRYLAVADTDTQSAHRKASPVDRWKL